MRTILAEFVPDVVFHLAGSSSVPESVAHPAQDLRANLVPTLGLLETFKNHASAALLVFASSAAVYGEPTYLPVDEEHPTRPTSPYGISKLCAERYVSLYAQLYGLRTVCVRLFSIYGPGHKKQVVYDLIQKLSGRDPEPLWGDGTQVRDLLYVSDAVSALMTVACQGHSNGAVYNICSGQGVSVLDLETELRSLLHNPASPGYRDCSRPGDPQRWIGSGARIHALGSYPKVSLQEGLSRTIDWVINSHAHSGAQSR
jgi:UDP-glucose 4-epimerase